MTDEAHTFDRFNEYRKTHDITGMRLSNMPEDVRAPAKDYLMALSEQLSDPENQSWDGLGPNEHHNALVAVRMKYKPAAERVIKGDCKRCDGTGYIRAFSHIRGGVCLACEGTGGKA